MAQCAAPRQTEDGETWISHRIARSYLHLHMLGHAHSIECWHENQLVGGLYGVGFDRVFCGESMFSRMTDASKVALAWLVAAMRAAGQELLDCQFITPHLASLGAVQITQKRYLGLLTRATRPYSAAGTGEGAAGGDAAGDATGGASAAAPDGGLAAGPARGVPEGFAALLEDAALSGFASSPGKRISQRLIHTS